jgi:hypothetical protein
MREYRIVTNGTWYEIEYKYRYWPFWFRLEPSRYALPHLRKIKYKFSSLELASERIKELRKQDTYDKWKVVHT